MNTPLSSNPDTGQSPSRAEIFGLATLAGHAGTRRDLRIKAIRALASIPDQNAIRVLGEMALWEEDRELSNEAYRSLEATFGDDLPEVLEGIRQELTGQWSSPTLEDDEVLVPEEPEPENLTSRAIPFAGTPPAVEGTPLWVLWLILGAVILGAAVYYFLLR